MGFRIPKIWHILKCFASGQSIGHSTSLISEEWNTDFKNNKNLLTITNHFLWD